MNGCYHSEYIFESNAHCCFSVEYCETGDINSLWLPKNSDANFYLRHIFSNVLYPPDFPTNIYAMDGLVKLGRELVWNEQDL